MLVRHSLPVVAPVVPPSRWVLSETGRGRCAALADQLARFGPSAIYASTEPKATETARIVAARLAVNLRVREGLEEHHRDDTPFFESSDEFEDAVRRLFAAPNELVHGSETATTALARFERAVDAAIDDATDTSVVIVSHGTVISLLVAQRTGLEPMKIWTGLTMPCYMVLELPSYDLLDIVSDIA